MLRRGLQTVMRAREPNLTSAAYVVRCPSLLLLRNLLRNLLHNMLRSLLHNPLRNRLTASMMVLVPWRIEQESRAL